VRFIFTATIFLILSAPCLQAQTAPQSYLFVAEPQAIEGFNINNTTGAIVAVPGSPFVNSNGPVAIAINSPATFLFSANANSTVSVFQIASSGALAEITGSPFNISDGSLPGAIAVSVDGTVLYVALGISNANQASGQLDSFTISTSGQLTELASAPAPSLAGLPALPASIIATSTTVYLAAGNVVQSYTFNQNVPTAATTTNLPSGTVSQMIGNANFLFVARTPQFSQNGFIDSLAISNSDGSLSLVATYDAGLFNPELNLALSEGYLFSNQNTYAIGTNGSLTPNSLNWENAPFVPLAASSTQPFLFEGDQAIGQGNGPLIFPLVVSSNGEVSNAEPPLNLNGVPSQIIVATGTTPATSVPAVIFEPAVVNFSPVTVGQNSVVQITIYSTGSVPLTINSLVVSGDNSFTEQSSTCSSSLAPGQTCFVYIEFAPGGASAFTGVLTLNGDVSGTVALSGTGTAAPTPPPNPPTPTPASVSVAPSAQSGTPGSQFSYAVSTAGFSGTPQISATCAIPMGSCVMNGSTLTVTTTAPSTMAALSVRWLVPLGLCLGGLLCVPRKRRELVLCVGALTFLAACGGTGSKLATATPPPTTTAGTPAGTYTVQLSAAAGSTKATATAQVVIQ
jgi:hypothetical protein